MIQCFGSVAYRLNFDKEAHYRRPTNGLGGLGMDTATLDGLKVLLEGASLDQVLALACDYLCDGEIGDEVRCVFDREGAKRATAAVSAGGYYGAFRIALICCKPETVVEFAANAVAAHPSASDPVNVLVYRDLGERGLHDRLVGKA